MQARVRGTTLMALSNAEGHLVLATGNKSELAVGYSTIYGDAVGGFAPIKDVPKTLVWALARWRNADAEARGETAADPGELDHASRRRPSCGRASSTPTRCPTTRCSTRSWSATSTATQGVAEIVAAGFDADDGDAGSPAWSTRAEWKRRQYPPGPKISLKAFGRDRRLPITNRWVERAAVGVTDRHVTDHLAIRETIHGRHGAPLMSST